MLWNLYGEAAGQAFRSWNTCVKLAWDVPRWTHNYFVDNLLGGGLPPVRKKLLCQFVSFFQKMRTCPLREVRILARVVGRDGNSVTGHNLVQLEREFDMDPWTVPSGRFKADYTGYEVPEQDKWRLPLLEKMLSQRKEMVTCGDDVVAVTELIDSLCSS